MSVIIVVVVPVGTKIARSRDLGICACCNAPINCLPHLPTWSKGGGTGGDLTHIFCKGPTPGRDQHCQIPHLSPTSPLSWGGDLPQWHRTIKLQDICYSPTVIISPLNPKSLLGTCDICPTPRAIFSSHIPHYSPIFAPGGVDGANN